MRTIAVEATPTHYKFEIKKTFVKQGPTVLQRKGQPVAVLVSMSDYQQLRSTPDPLEGAIIKDPTLRGGRPIIAGTGTTVRTIAALYKLGLSAEEIMDELPLTLGQVYAALTYYQLNSAEIEADIQADSEEALMQEVELIQNE